MGTPHPCPTPGTRPARGPGCWEGERDAVAGERGWPLYLEMFADLPEA
ncbi:MAG: hypothetical protein R3266_11820 [Gemmatimonadota bacterium]|nr:hypothetical protein [Gemmatimonadota bacterium]